MDGKIILLLVAFISLVDSEVMIDLNEELLMNTIWCRNVKLRIWLVFYIICRVNTVNVSLNGTPLVNVSTYIMNLLWLIMNNLCYSVTEHELETNGLGLTGWMNESYLVHSQFSYSNLSNIDSIPPLFSL